MENPAFFTGNPGYHLYRWTMFHSYIRLLQKLLSQVAQPAAEHASAVRSTRPDLGENSPGFSLLILLMKSLLSKYI